MIDTAASSRGLAGSFPASAMPHEPDIATIVVADDDPSNVALIQNALPSNHWDVLVATTGIEAIHLARRHQPEAILLDVHMPEMDGYEACRLLKEYPGTRRIPVLFVSGLRAEFNYAKAFEIGASDYISKPIQVEELRARLAAHVQISRLNRSNAHLQAELNSAIERGDALAREARELARQLDEVGRG